MLPIWYVHPGRVRLLPHMCQGLRREVWWTFPGDNLFHFTMSKGLLYVLLIKIPSDAFNHIVLFQTAGTCARDLRCLRQCECKTNTKKNCVFPFSYQVTYIIMLKDFWNLISNGSSCHLLKQIQSMNHKISGSSLTGSDLQQVHQRWIRKWCLLVRN